MNTQLMPRPMAMPAVNEPRPCVSLAIREIDDPDLFVRYINRHPGYRTRLLNRRLRDRLLHDSKVKA